MCSKWTVRKPKRRSETGCRPGRPALRRGRLPARRRRRAPHRRRLVGDDVAERLTAAGWSDTEPSCFIWEGVTNYLTAEAVARVLGWIGCTAPGSTIVFTYIHKGLLDGTVPFAGGATMLSNVRALAEPWTFGLYPEELPEYLQGFRLTLREDLGADEYRTRTGLTGATGYAFYRLAVAGR